MSAQIWSREVSAHLALQPSPLLNRCLHINAGHKYLRVSIALAGSNGSMTAMAAFAFAPIDEARLDIRETRADLWLPGTAFDLTLAEAERVAAVFQPLGLSVLRPEEPLAPTLSQLQPLRAV